VGRKLKFTLEDVEAYVDSTHHAPVGRNALAARVPAAALRGASTHADDPEASNAQFQSLSDAASFGVLEGRSFVIAGGDPVADMVASALNARGLPATRLVRGGYTALVNLYAGDADAAVVSLYDQSTNSFNVPYVRNLAPGASVVMFRLYGRERGFIVKWGNPKKLTTWGALLREGVRLSNREKGSASRVLLDEKLRSMDARSEAIEGYDTHYPVGDIAVRRVASGISDVAIGTEQDAKSVSGVQFVPLQMEWVDLVVRKTRESRSAIATLKEVLASDRLRHSLSTLQPCDFSKLGVIVYES
jgi:putative molybdopterin biosynthesis protein